MITSRLLAIFDITKTIAEIYSAQQHQTIQTPFTEIHKKL